LNLTEALIPIFAYLLPILFFIYMGIDVLLRNTKSAEHRLVSVMVGCYLLLFLEEYIRHQLPMEYSGALAAKWFGNVGILIPGIGFHVLCKFAGFDKRMPRYIYPYIFYLPVIVVIINLLSTERIISTDQFVQLGMWKAPIYNRAYYIAITVSLFVSALFLIVISKGKSSASTQEHRAIFNLLTFGASLVLVWTVVFGYINYGESLPPYPYIYAGLIWCFTLRLAMKRFDFLNFVDKKYERLFNLSPAAILLVDQSGSIKEANPSATQLFHPIQLKRAIFYDLVGKRVKDQIQSRKEIIEFETTLYNEGKNLEVLIDGDYVLVDNEPHIILIIRDITVQKENQKVITFMAYHDPLTLLPNRRFFYDEFEAAIHDARKRRRQLALMIIDLDHFKETNDTYGHKAGDEVLQHAAKIIKETAAQQGMAARLGGDEFVFFLRDIPSVEFVKEIIQQLRHKFSENVLMYENHAIPIGMSIGVSIFPDEGNDGDSLMNSADRAMYVVKRNGRNDFHLSG
jgi:diguanylate cyclase (GGDEF)-like protein